MYKMMDKRIEAELFKAEDTFMEQKPLIQDITIGFRRHDMKDIGVEGRPYLVKVTKMDIRFKENKVVIKEIIVISNSPGEAIKTFMDNNYFCSYWTITNIEAVLLDTMIDLTERIGM